MKINEQEIANRRGELLAQQFLLDLGAVYVAEPGPDLGIDYLVGFRSASGETKIIGIEVKTSAGHQSEQLQISQDRLAYMSHMNIPVLILAIDPKLSSFYVAWAREAAKRELGQEGHDVIVPLRPVDSDHLPELKEQILAA